MSEVFEDFVRWGNTKIPFTYQYAPRKTLAITVHPDLKVTIRAPIGTHPKAIRTKVFQRGNWIRRAWREFELYLPKQPPRRYIGGESHRYLGRQYRLKITEGYEESVKLLGGHFWVTTNGEPNSEKVKELLESWYMTHARKIFYERLETCYKETRYWGIPLPALRIKKMRTRWGSCGNNGRINLSLELVKAPKDCIDYVIAHEMCHLKEKHHGPRFWNLLKHLMPDYKERRERLNLYADL